MTFNSACGEKNYKQVLLLWMKLACVVEIINGNMTYIMWMVEKKFFITLRDASTNTGNFFRVGEKVS